MKVLLLISFFVVPFGDDEEGLSNLRSDLLGLGIRSEHVSESECYAGFSTWLQLARPVVDQFRDEHPTIQFDVFSEGFCIEQND